MAPGESHVGVCGVGRATLYAAMPDDGRGVWLGTPWNVRSGVLTDGTLVALVRSRMAGEPVPAALLADALLDAEYTGATLEISAALRA